MRSTKSIYKRKLIFWLCLWPAVIFLFAIRYEKVLTLVVVAVVAIENVYYLCRVLWVRRLERRCLVCDGIFVGVEKRSIGWRHSRFAVLIEIDTYGERRTVYTPGVYASRDISGVTAGSVVRIGCTQDFSTVIIL